jgi:hypothetical protein
VNLFTNQLAEKLHNMQKIMGVTRTAIEGNIGSGKSTVSGSVK